MTNFAARKHVINILTTNVIDELRCLSLQLLTHFQVMVTQLSFGSEKQKKPGIQGLIDRKPVAIHLADHHQLAWDQ
ncbi:MAG: hypothetical protein ACI9UN_004724 [Granulosicoccus sp.]|jgi:hypothetical protein